ncbi:MAG: signal peptide peptidase SppA, partial [Bacteroidia bacterium]
MKNFFGSLLGALLGIVVVGVIFVLIIVSSVKSSFEQEKTITEIKPGSVLHLKLDAPILERQPLNPFPSLSKITQNQASIGLNLLLDQISKAKTDANIKGIYLEAPDVAAGMATTEDLRNALLDFRKSGKFIVSYSEMYSQKGYYLASASNKILLHPEGGIEFKGLSAEITFYKKMLEKLEIDVQIFRHGKFKSAVEPFDLEKMSDANRLQTATYVNSLWDHMVDSVAASRKMNRTNLNQLAAGLRVRNASDAVNYNLADATIYRDEVYNELRTQCKSLNNPDLVNVLDYQNVAAQKAGDQGDSEEASENDPAIAIVYAVGSIESGQGDDATIGSDRIAQAIADARNDASVKAIVLRVNSPGGSALASDVIWREVSLTKGKKPIVVSMGDVAASGGYYIACAADKIVAQPNTITGSIGVFGLLPNLKNMLENKIGLTHD